MRLSVKQTTTNDGTRRTLLLSNVENYQSDRIESFFDMLGEQAPPPRVLDGFVFGTIFYAMRSGQDVHVEGALSREALRNFDEFQDAWTLWRPDRYRKIGISCESVLDDADLPGRENALAAFSGGVDSVFTVLRHSKQSLGNASYPLNDSVLLVHGFDVRLSEPDHLKALKDRIAPFIESRGLRIRVIRTNLKKLGLQDWEDSFLAQLACCLHNYAHEFRYGLAASAEAYDSLFFPSGSTPATTHLLSGQTFRLIHDGSGFSRTAKVREISKDPVATKILKVCWEGRESFRNCGHCEKCLRTRLNFLAVGQSDPPCFESPLNMAQIEKITVTTVLKLREFQSIIEFAKSRGLDEPWMKSLQRYIDSNRKRPTPLQALRRKSATALRLIAQGKWDTLAHKVMKTNSPE